MNYVNRHKCVCGVLLNDENLCNGCTAVHLCEDCEQECPVCSSVICSNCHACEGCMLTYETVKKTIEERERIAKKKEEETKEEKEEARKQKHQHLLLVGHERHSWHFRMFQAKTSKVMRQCVFDF